MPSFCHLHVSSVSSDYLSSALITVFFCPFESYNQLITTNLDIQINFIGLNLTAINENKISNIFSFSEITHLMEPLKAAKIPLRIHFH